MTGITDLFKLPFTKFQPDACQHGVICPIAKGKTYNYTESIFIANYPKVITNIQNCFRLKQFVLQIPVTVRLELVDDNQREVVCVDINVRII